MIAIGKVCYEKVERGYSLDITNNLIKDFKEDTLNTYDCPEWFKEMEITPKLIATIYNDEVYEDDKDAKKFYEYSFFYGQDSYDFITVVDEYFEPLIFEIGEHEIIDTDVTYSYKYVIEEEEEDF